MASDWYINCQFRIDTLVADLCHFYPSAIFSTHLSSVVRRSTSVFKNDTVDNFAVVFALRHRPR